MKRVTVAVAVWLALGGGVAAQTSPSAREAVAGLETLHQAIARGLDYAEYRRRLAETKATFDRYAVRSSATVAEAEVKAALSAAMNDHRFAEALWADRLRHDGELPRASFDRLGVTPADRLLAVAVAGEGVPLELTASAVK